MTGEPLDALRPLDDGLRDLAQKGKKDKRINILYKGLGQMVQETEVVTSQEVVDDTTVADLGLFVVAGAEEEVFVPISATVDIETLRAEIAELQVSAVAS